MSNNYKIKIGTRGSKLALWQANYISDKLKENNFDTEIIIIETKGDKILDTSISKIGSKGVFTEELEAKLRNGAIDIAVHSAKDLQSEISEGLEIVAFSEREKPNDVLLSKNKNLPLLSDGKPFIVGTSSTRRVAMLKHYYPHIKIVDMRGNLQTRIQKMELGACDALILAYAGIHRVNFENYIKEILPTSAFTPAVGQGCIAVEAKKNLGNPLLYKLKEILNHPETEKCLTAERQYLSILQGGCSVPVFALAEPEAGSFKINGGIISLDGEKIIRYTLIGKEPDLLGKSLAHDVLNSGGDEILRQIRASANKQPAF